MAVHITIITLTSNVKFLPGMVTITPTALEACTHANIQPATLLARHFAADWGNVDDADKAANDYALLMGGQLLSVYTLPTHQDVWIRSTANRRYTTVLLPSDD